MKLKIFEEKSSIHSDLSLKDLKSKLKLVLDKMGPENVTWLELS